MKVFRTILVILNVLVALGLVLTTLAGEIRPSQSIVPSLLAFGFLPMLGVNVAMVVVWALMKRWEFLISTAVIALRWTFVGLFFQVGGTTKVPDRAEHPQMVTLMTYNVHMFMGPGEKAAPEDSVAREFLALVDEYQPDVLCMQEFQYSGARRTTDSLVMKGYNHYHGTRMSGTTPLGTVVFSRFPITYVSQIDGQRLLVELMHDSCRFRVFCIHMDSYQFDRDDKEEFEKIRHGEVSRPSKRTMGKVKETIRCHEEEWEQKLSPVVTESSVPLVLAGDLNDIPTSWLYRQISRHMSDTYREKGLGYCYTYNGNPPKFRIDMVFHNEGLRTLSYKRIRSTVSDHYPVFTSMELVP